MLAEQSARVAAIGNLDTIEDGTSFTADDKSSVAKALKKEIEERRATVQNEQNTRIASVNNLHTLIGNTGGSSESVLGSFSIGSLGDDLSVKDALGTLSSLLNIEEANVNNLQSVMGTTTSAHILAVQLAQLDHSRHGRAHKAGSRSAEHTRHAGH